MPQAHLSWGGGNHMSKDLALFIDARNALYTAIYAVKADRYKRPSNHYVVALLHLISNWIRHHNPSSVHIFWDAPRVTVWRKLVLSTYKNRIQSQYVEDISEDLRSSTKIVMEVFKYLNCRQYSKKQMEADDLIYAASVVRHPKSNIIITTDSDMTQIPFYLNSCSVYNPRKNAIVEVPSYNPAVYKAIVGDKSDHIPGYHGIGPKRGSALMEHVSDLEEFLNNSDRSIFNRNMLLIDLSLCPKLMANKLYVQKIMAEKTSFDSTAINKLAIEHKLRGFDVSYADIIPPFQNLK